MSIVRLASRSARPAKTFAPCCFCQLNETVRVSHDSTTPHQRRSQWLSQAPLRHIKRRNYASKSLNVSKIRADVDNRARLGFYTLSNQQGALRMDPHKADSIYADFLHHKNKMDYGTNVRRLAEKYKLDVEDLTSLAIVTFKIPDVSDPARKAMLPPSQHKTVSGQLLQGCAQAEEPLAIVHILTAVYLSNSNADIAAKEIAGLFPRSELASYRKTLENMCLKAQKFALGPDALTLQGVFLEREGQKQKAENLYIEAVLRCHLNYQPGSRHPMQLPLIAPWNALGYLLKSTNDPKLQAQAKSYFEKGALQGDDPLSYYELAAYEQKTSPKWLQYTSKAAASGHKVAIVNLANFYLEASSEGSPVLESSAMRKALSWLLGWKSGSIAHIAEEWLKVASNIGHKPSTMKLADHQESVGNTAGAQEYLRQIVEPPAAADRKEEWPQLVQLAKRRLAGVRS